jgi:queuine tRNA-ribosyltransferase
MSGPLELTIVHRCAESGARLGVVRTPHGRFETPAFMPVGTRGTVRGLLPAQLRAAGTEILLSNAYHLMLRPGDGAVARRGGVHAFMRWDGPILTDSGGYQAFSMAELTSIDDDGVTFRSIVDGRAVRLSPERSIEVQNNLGADVIMAFDDCPPAGRDPGSRDPAGAARRMRTAHERTARWLPRCVRAHRRPEEQALFGIVQGGIDPALRRASVDAICAIDLPGYAIGGVAVGESPEEIHAIVQATAPLLPADRPRYLMGVGYERDIVAAVRAGVDMFDCVLPTRNGRNGQAFTRAGRLHLRNAVFAEDDGVIEPGCDCVACGGGFARAYLRHLFMAREMLGPILVSLHNVRHFHSLLLDIRRAVRDNAWSSLTSAWPVLGHAIGSIPVEREDDARG